MIFNMADGWKNPVVIFQPWVYGFDRIQTRVPGFDIGWVTCQWQTHKSFTINSYAAVRWKCGWLEYLDDSRRSVPVLQKRQLKQHHMSTTNTSYGIQPGYPKTRVTRPFSNPHRCKLPPNTRGPFPFHSPSLPSPPLLSPLLPCPPLRSRAPKSS